MVTLLNSWIRSVLFAATSFPRNIASELMRSSTRPCSRKLSVVNMTSSVSGALRLGLPVATLRTAVRQASTSAKKSGRKVESEKVTLVDRLIPPTFIVGVTLLFCATKQNQTGIYGVGWLGEIFFAPFGKHFVYRKKIEDQIKAQKEEDYKKGKYWPWRIWVG